MIKVAFATCQSLPQGSEDDMAVADALKRRNVAVTFAVWDSPNIEWSQFDSVIIRSTWDYYLKPDCYAEWLASFAGSGTQLWNPPELVRENLHKSYLATLAKKGVEVVPSAYVIAARPAELREVLETHGWAEAVIKPAISANAFGTWRTSLSTAAVDEKRFAEQVRSHDVLVQPYLPEVASKGEWSLIFFRGQYSHAVLKRPSVGDFRVQREFGGQAIPAAPTADLVEAAESILSIIPQDLLYARVDGIERNGRFVLMELEINEPYLFINSSADGATRFADAILSVLSD